VPHANEDAVPHADKNAVPHADEHAVSHADLARALTPNRFHVTSELKNAAKDDENGRTHAMFEDVRNVVDEEYQHAKPETSTKIGQGHHREGSQVMCQHFPVVVLCGSFPACQMVPEHVDGIPIQKQPPQRA
jgi:hypothetical protein